jgi:hypothetical protein
MDIDRSITGIIAIFIDLLVHLYFLLKIGFLVILNKLFKSKMKCVL